MTRSDSYGTLQRGVALEICVTFSHGSIQQNHRDCQAQRRTAHTGQIEHVWLDTRNRSARIIPRVHIDVNVSIDTFTYPGKIKEYCKLNVNIFGKYYI